MRYVNMTQKVAHDFESLTKKKLQKKEKKHYPTNCVKNLCRTAKGEKDNPVLGGGGGRGGGGPGGAVAAVVIFTTTSVPPVVS